MPNSGLRFDEARPGGQIKLRFDYNYPGADANETPDGQPLRYAAPASGLREEARIGTVRPLLALAALNLLACGAEAIRDRANRLALHLTYASLLNCGAVLPAGWLPWAPAAAGNPRFLAVGTAAYLVIWSAWLAHPKLAVLGSLILGSGIEVLGAHQAAVTPWAWQAAFIFLLLHSLRWNDRKYAEAGKVRLLLGLAWVVQSFIWMNSGGKFWMPLLPAGFVLIVYCACFPCRGIWRLGIVPAAALAAMLSGPCSALVEKLTAAPAGLIAVLASFLFLAGGTVAALTRQFWHIRE